MYEEMRWPGLLLWFLGCTRLYRDGDGFDILCRAWHPLIWLTMLLTVVPCAIMGEKLSDVFPFTLSDFWKANRDQLRWVTPFTKIADIPDFVGRPANPALA